MNSQIVLLQIITLICVLVLITITVTRKRFKKSPSEVAYRHELIYEAIQKSTNGIIVITKLGEIVYWNGGAERMLGWREDEVKGKNISIIIPERLKQAHSKGMERLHQTGVAHVLDKPLDTFAVHRFGEEIPVSLTISESKINTVVHYTGIVKNIRERYEKEQEIIEREKMHKKEIEMFTIAEKIDCTGVWSWDISTGFVLCSEGFNNIFETDDFVSDVTYLMKRVYYQDRDMLQKIIDASISEKKDYSVKYRINRLSGEPIWILCKAKMFLRANGTLERIIGVIRKLETNEVS